LERRTRNAGVDRRRAARGASADPPDAWITTKAKIALLTSKDTHATGVNVDTVNGTVTIHGKVNTAAEKANAEAAVRGIEGVKQVRNLLQVVPDAEKRAVKASDAEIKKQIEDKLEADKSLGGIKVASVNKGVVLLSGEAKSLDRKLQAIEVAYACPGVERVATEIETVEK